MIRPRTLFLLLVAVSLLFMTNMANPIGSAEPAAEETANEAAGEATAAPAPAAKDESAKEAAADAQTAPSAGAELSGMRLIAENEVLALYFHNETTEIAVKDKRNGTVWHSNPAGREQEKRATPFNKARLGSQLTITYYNSAGQANEFDNFNDSISNKQFEIVQAENGVKIVYTMGDNSLGVEAVPRRISVERMESKILSKIKDEKTKQDILKRFKLIKEQNVYERRDAALTDVALKRLLKVFEEVGYTQEDVALDNRENGAGEDAGTEKPAFTIPIQYRLDGENLVVTVPTKEIKQPKSYPLHSLKLLQFFGAADESKQGYIFVPDGSGSLIYLNNGKTFHDPFVTPVYGLDNARFTREKSQFDEPARLPVFGMKQDDSAFFAIIENGDAIASIEADVSGRLDSYNQVYSSYTLIAKDELTLTGGYRSNTVPVFQSEMYEGDIVIRYAFLNGPSADYAGMARYYQDYLARKHQWNKLPQASDLPFYLELIGAVTKKKSFLGIPYNALEPLTTFSQAQEIVRQLKAANVNNVKLRYVGWFNRGVNHTIPTSVTPDGKLGGKKQFAELAGYAKANGIGLYPDVAFLNVYKDTWNFSLSREASRFINRKPAKLYPFNPATYERDPDKTPYYILSPSRLPAYVNKFIESYKPYGIAGISLRDLGEEVNSDFRNDRVVNRQEAANLIKEQMKLLREQFNDTLIVGGNAPALPYAKHVLHVPLSGSHFNITDESVPFYQMVIHGFIDYAGEPVNVSDGQSVKKSVLKALETGSNVYFQWFYEPSSAVKETEFDYMYSSHYKDWLSEAKTMYEEVNRVLKDVRDQRIVAHAKLADNVYRTVYENGRTIIVNYNKEAVRAEGFTIEPESYVIGGDHR